MSTKSSGSEAQLSAWIEAAVDGDRAAAQQVLRSIQDGVYRLALRMLGHPQDAEDAAQEILLVVLTHLGSFRGESAFSTWVFRIAARRLTLAKRGRRESDSLEALEGRLVAMDSDPAGPQDPESAVFAREVRLRCTQAMLLGLDRPSRIAYLLADVFDLSGEEAAAVLEIDPATFRKRLARARQRLYDFMRRRCGIFDPENPCRCERVAAGAVARGLLRRDQLLFATHPREPPGPALDRAAREVTALMRVAEVVEEHPRYAAPESMLARIRDLLDSGNLELLRD
jgi:RNA polymerase sigma factor (sigma-70 family)